MGKNFKVIRIMREEAQQDVAERIGIDNTYLSRIENGRLKGSKHVIKKLEKYFQLK